jgi:pimeloyl-ACP methyl ester carboxylesterase
VTFLVDSSVLLDVMTEDVRWFTWSADAIARAADGARLVINPVIYAEVSVRYRRIEDLDEALPRAMFEREAIPFETAFLAGKSYLAERWREAISAARFLHWCACRYRRLPIADTRRRSLPCLLPAPRGGCADVSSTASQVTYPDARADDIIRPMTIMPGFTLTDIETSGARIRLRHGGNGPPLLLLHGNPLTHASWHKVAPRLAEHFHVVAADLRGYGDSSAPPEEPGSANYSFRAMAQDQVEVMQSLGHSRFFVAGHDRGGRTTHRMCLDHPDKVIKAAIIDIVPTLDMWAAMDKQGAIGGWHWPFMAQPADFPERMLGGVPADWFMRKKLLKLTANRDLGRVRPLLQREDDPRLMRRLSRRRHDRL